jgi:hypothetical protein
MYRSFHKFSSRNDGLITLLSNRLRTGCEMLIASSEIFVPCCPPIHQAVHLLANVALFTVCPRSVNMFSVEKILLFYIEEMKSL